MIVEGGGGGRRRRVIVGQQSAGGEGSRVERNAGEEAGRKGKERKYIKGGGGGVHVIVTS